MSFNMYKYFVVDGANEDDDDDDTEWIAIACYQYTQPWVSVDLLARRDFLAEMHIRRMPGEAMCG